MPTMASVKLSTGRPIVNHPLRRCWERTKLDTMYSRISADTVKGNLMTLGIWDIEDSQNVGKVPLCAHMSRSSRPHFTTVFSNDIYKVLKVSKDLR
ncbi:hypothetical protein F7725_017929 [Dissostichus mawsoni]|uniref:Uncharacterized protein n=1 Tax=Dissostichus mawsoni TaxID=36200 RepID=A0A7J5XQ64_DISMA|nr:hypothetical protein F7725_017929 [Dissostichus mawsoni]